MRQALQRAWLGKGLLARALLPLSWVYAAVAATHRGLFNVGLLRRRRLPVPVIVVGNVLAGGAGKTPVVMAVVRRLQSRGLRPGVISRGYGGRMGGAPFLEVLPDSDPGVVGDEPLLIRQRCDAPVFVSPDRAHAGLALLAAHPHVQVVVSDDGLQHHALERDVEVCVFDDRGIGNGWRLPAGPLRESWPRPADAVLRPALLAASIEGHDVRRVLASHAVQADGTRKALADFKGPVHAVAGIARPEAFFAMLRAQGVPLARCTALPDHHDFSDFVPDAGGDPLICTEKDAVKLWRIRPDAWSVPLLTEIDAAFWAPLDQLLDAKLISS